MPTKARGYWFCEYCPASFDTSDEADEHELYDCFVSPRRRPRVPSTALHHFPPPPPPGRLSYPPGIIMPPYSVYPPPSQQQQQQQRSYAQPPHGRPSYPPPPLPPHHAALPPSPPYEFDILTRSSPPPPSSTTGAAAATASRAYPSTAAVVHRGASVTTTATATAATSSQQQQRSSSSQSRRNSNQRSSSSSTTMSFYLWDNQYMSLRRFRLSPSDEIACQHVELVELWLNRTSSATGGAVGGSTTATDDDDEEGGGRGDGSDSRQARSSSSSSPPPLPVYQIGLRCRHCGARGANHMGEVIIPRSISNLPDALRTWCHKHLLQQACPYVATDDRETLLLIHQSAQQEREQEQEQQSQSNEQQQQRKALLNFCRQKCREWNMIDRQPSGIIVASASGRRESDERRRGGSRDDDEEEIDARETASTTNARAAATAAAEHRHRPAANEEGDEEVVEVPPPYYERPSDLSYPPRPPTGGRFSPPLSPPPYWEQPPPGLYHPTTTSSSLPLSFPFFHDADGGDWMCKYCHHLPPQYRDAHFRWQAPPSSSSRSTTTLPPPEFIDLHLHYCRAYHHHLQLLQEQQQHRQQPPSQQQQHQRQQPSSDFGPPPSAPAASASSPAAASPSHLYSFQGGGTGTSTSTTSMYGSPPPQSPYHPSYSPVRHRSTVSSPSSSRIPPPLPSASPWESVASPGEGRTRSTPLTMRPSAQRGGGSTESPYVPHPPPASAPGRMEGTALLMPASPSSPIAPVVAATATSVASATSMGRMRHSMGLDRSAQRAIEFLSSVEQKRLHKATSMRTSAAMTSADRFFPTGRGPSGRPEASLPLVRDEDKLLLTDFLFHLMKQLQLVRFSEADRKTRGGKREKILLGYGGLECIHCAPSPKARKFFWSGVDRLANSFAEIPGHVFKCPSCPDEIKDALTQLKSIHAEQMSRLPRGSQKVFFRRVWKRLHEGDPEEPMAFDESHPMAQQHTASPEDSKPSQQQQQQQHSPEGTSGSEESIFTMQRPTKDAAKALADASFQAGPPSPSSRVLLGIVEDRDFLSNVDCLIRRQIEVFCATKDDVRVAYNDRKYPIYEGQVGIRCVHCSMRRNGPGAKGHAVAYPFSISGIFEAVREFQRLHLDYCENVPHPIRSKISEIMKESATITSIQRKYYALAAKGLGLYDTQDGIRAGSESVAVVSQAVFAFESEASPEAAGSVQDDVEQGDELADVAARGSSPLSESGASMELFGSQGRKRRRREDDYASTEEASTKKRYPSPGSGGDHPSGQGPPPTEI